MRIVLVGAPGSGKTEVAQGIRKSIKQLWIDVASGEDLGPLADYRAEAKTAINRATFMASEDSMIFEHSVIDSLAYVTIRLVTAIETTDYENYARYTLLMAFLGMVVQDSFAADVIFFCPGHNGEPYSEELENALQQVCESLMLPLIVLEGTNLQRVEQAVKIVEDELMEKNGAIDQGADPIESAQQDR